LEAPNCGKKAKKNKLLRGIVTDEIHTEKDNFDIEIENIVKTDT